QSRTRRRGERRPLRQRLKGDKRRRRAAGACRLRGRAGAPDPRRLAQGRGLRAARRRDRAECQERPPDRRDVEGPRRGDPAGADRRRSGRRAGRDRGRAGRRGPARAGLRELRPVPRLRGARRGVQEAGAEPVRVKRKSMDASILTLVTLALVAFGLVMVYSATSASAALHNGDPAYFLKRQAGYALLGLVLLTTVFCVLLLAEPDLGTAIAILLMLAAMLLVAGTPVRVLGAGLGIAAAVSMAAVWFEPYRRARLFSFIDPWRDAHGAGYQTVQAIIGLGSGGIFGRGLGQSVAKLNLLPEAHTDMIFAIIGEELGLVGATALVAAYGAFAYAGLRIALTCRDPFGKRLAAGLTVLVFGQASVNLAAVMGLAPLTRIPLPVVPYGGSSLV